MDGVNENAGRAGKYLNYWPIQENRGEILVDLVPGRSYAVQDWQGKSISGMTIPAW